MNERDKRVRQREPLSKTRDRMKKRPGIVDAEGTMFNYRLLVRLRGQALKTWRLIRGLQQKELAQVLEVSPSTVHDWEKGRNRPTLKQIDDLARMLGVNMTAITK